MTNYGEHPRMLVIDKTPRRCHRILQGMKLGFDYELSGQRCPCCSVQYSEPALKMKKLHCPQATMGWDQNADQPERHGRK